MRLHAVEGPGSVPGRIVPLEKDSAIFGRHPDCDIVLDSGAVSRQHARIVNVEGKLYLEDLRSRNGTFVNGKQIHQPHLLEEGDRITLCDMVFIFRKDPSQVLPGTDSGPLHTALVVDDEHVASNTTVMSRLNIAAGSSSLRLEVNPHVKLKALIDITQCLSRTLRLDDVLPRLLSGLFDIFAQADRGVLVLRDAKTGRLVPKAVRHRRQELIETVHISRTIVQRVMAGKEAILSANVPSDARFNTAESIVDFHIRSVMCAPLINRDGQVLGVIQIDTMDQRNRFNLEDLEVLAGVASQATIAVENAELHEAAVREQALRGELRVAHQVLRGLLPSATPRIAQYEFFDFYEAAHELGGDYYDYIPLSGERVAVVVADVAGKGIPAALLMAKLSADARYCLASEPTAAKAVERLNRVFCASGQDDRFVTLVAAVLDPARHEVTLVNAGHMPPLLRRGESVSAAVENVRAFLPLGVDQDAQYGEVTLSLTDGDCLAMYTDGITEAMNSADDLYGMERLQRQLTVSASGIAGHGRNILGDVKRFVGSRSQADDMCLVCFGRTTA